MLFSIELNQIHEHGSFLPPAVFTRTPRIDEQFYALILKIYLLLMYYITEIA